MDGYRLKQLAGNTLDTQARIDGLIEIEDLTAQLAKYERTLNDMDFNPGEGFVAAGASGRINSPLLQRNAIRAGLPDPKGAGVPEAVSQHHFYTPRKTSPPLTSPDNRSGETHCRTGGSKQLESATVE